MQTLTQRLANPTRFMALSGQLLPWISALAGLLIAVGLYLGFTAPLDYQQGHAAKIMYVHVPAAWLSMLGYALVAGSSFGLLVFRHPLADGTYEVQAAAPNRQPAMQVRITVVIHAQRETWVNLEMVP